MELRARVLDFVRRHPGVHEREVERRLGLSGRLAAYHLGVLAGEGKVRRFADGQYQRYVDAAQKWTAADLRALAALRKPVALRIAVLLLDRGGLAHGEVAAALGLAKASASHHLGHLVQAGILTAQPQGRRTVYGVADPPHARALVGRSEPFPDDLGAFGAVWDDLVGPG